LEIPRWTGVSNPKFLKESMKLDWKFHRGRESFTQENCQGGDLDIISSVNYTQWALYVTV